MSADNREGWGQRGTMVSHTRWWGTQKKKKGDGTEEIGELGNTSGMCMGCGLILGGGSKFREVS